MSGRLSRAHVRTRALPRSLAPSLSMHSHRRLNDLQSSTDGLSLPRDVHLRDPKRILVCGFLHSFDWVVVIKRLRRLEADLVKASDRAKAKVPLNRRICNGVPSQQKGPRT